MDYIKSINLRITPDMLSPSQGVLRIEVDMEGETRHMVQLTYAQGHFETLFDIMMARAKEQMLLGIQRQKEAEAERHPTYGQAMQMIAMDIHEAQKRRGPGNG